MPPTTDQADRRLYQPLDRNSRQIRLIEILPTQPDETIKCKLHTVTLNPDTYYVCISYVWSDPSITEEIIVNGVRKQVTVNLATALRHLKKHWVEIESEADPDVDTSRFRLWADALCINQDDPLERGHQVGLMADIYSSAEMVLAWLSSDDRDVVFGFNVLDRVGQEGLLTGDSRDTLALLLPKRINIRESNVSQLRPDERSTHLRQFWKLGFWSRVWILQEVILAKGLYYISPSHRRSHVQCWATNRWVHRCLGQLGLGTDLTESQNEWKDMLLKDQRGVMNLFEARDPACQRSQEQFMLSCATLHFSEDLRATDNLDYVYGLRAISKVPIEPDYTKSIREVHISFAQWMVKAVSISTENTQCVYDLLDQHAVDVRQLHGLPTWAPVFSASDKRHNINLPRWSKSPLYEKRPPKVTSLGSLRTKAIMAQTVKVVYCEPGSLNFLDRGLSSFVHDFSKMYGKATYDFPMTSRGGPNINFPPTSVNRIPISEALCHTLLLEHDVGYNGRCLVDALTRSEYRRPKRFDLDFGPRRWNLAAERLLGSHLFTTNDGYIGLIGEEVFPGDVVCYLAGGKSLAVLRPKDYHYLFVNNCFVMGLMDDDAFKFIESRGLEAKEIEIR